jgi:hypothetical protein
MTYFPREKAPLAGMEGGITTKSYLRSLLGALLFAGCISWTTRWLSSYTNDLFSSPSAQAVALFATMMNLSGLLGKIDPNRSKVAKIGSGILAGMTAGRLYYNHPGALSSLAFCTSCRAFVLFNIFVLHGFVPATAFWVDQETPDVQSLVSIILATAQVVTFLAPVKGAVSFLLLHPAGSIVVYIAGMKHPVLWRLLERCLRPLTHDHCLPILSLYSFLANRFSQFRRRRYCRERSRI